MQKYKEPRINPSQKENHKQIIPKDKMKNQKSKKDKMKIKESKQNKHQNTRQ